MAEYYIAQNLADELIQIETTDVMTGDRNQSRFLYYQIIRKDVLFIQRHIFFIMKTEVKYT